MKNFFSQKLYVNILNGLHIPVFLAVIFLLFNAYEAKGATPESLLLYPSAGYAFLVGWLFNLLQFFLSGNKKGALKESVYTGIGGIFGGILAYWLYSSGLGYWMLAPSLAIFAFTYYLWKKK